MTKSQRLEEYRRQQIEQCKNLLRGGKTPADLIAKGYAAGAIQQAEREIADG